MDGLSIFWVGGALGVGMGAGYFFWQQQRLSAAMSEVKQLRDRAKQAELAYYQMVETSQFKSGFLARTAHELRSPLNGLISSHQLVLSDLCDDPAEEREFITHAHTSALKLVELLDQVIEVSRFDRGLKSPSLQPTSLGELLQKVHQLTTLLAADRNLPFHLTLPEPDLTVQADPQVLTQILVSSVSSAIELMSKGSLSLSVRRSPDGQSAQIWLEDERPATFWHEAADLVSQALPAPSGLTGLTGLTVPVPCPPAPTVTAAIGVTDSPADYVMAHSSAESSAVSSAASVVGLIPDLATTLPPELPSCDPVDCTASLQDWLNQTLKDVRDPIGAAQPRMSAPPKFSAPFNLLLQQHLLQQMQGQLELLAVPHLGDSNLTRLQYTIPLAQPAP